MITIHISSGVLVVLGFLTAFIVRSIYRLYKRKELYKKCYREMKEAAQGLRAETGNLLTAYKEQNKNTEELKRITEEALNLADRLTNNTHAHGAYKNTDHDDGQR